MVKNYKDISRRDFLFKIIDIFNVIHRGKLEITDKESLFFVESLLLPEKYKYQRFGTPARKYLLRRLEELGWKLSVQGLSQIITSLEEKHLIHKDTDGVRYVNKDFLTFIDTNTKNFTFQFNFNIKDE